MYEQPSHSAAVLGAFKPGTRILISPRDQDGWRKVVFRSRGRRTLGWIEVRQLSVSYIAPTRRPKETTRGLSTRYRDTSGLGLALVISYMQQKERSVALSDDVSVYEISSLTSQSFWPTVFYDFNLSPTWRLRTFLGYRTMLLQGESKLQAVGGSGETTGEVRIEQSFLSGGLSFRGYFSSSSNWWWGGGVEAGRNLGIKIIADGEELAVEDEDKPFFFFPHLGLGWDSKALWGIHFLPELKFGAVTTLKPTVYGIEAHLGVGYPF